MDIYKISNFINRCFDLARLGNGSTSPNPSVGAVIVSADGHIIGEGYTQPYGGSHAEVMAIRSISPENKVLLPLSTIYVSLEPCFHYGKTPPCVDLLIKEQILKVIVAAVDPNPLVAGKSMVKLRENGIEALLYEDLLRESAENNTITEGVHLVKNKQLVNGKDTTLLPFFTNILDKRPYIILKWAESADGFIGNDVEQVQISNAFSNRLVHKWRSEVDAIMVGTTTAQRDNPALTTRSYYGKSPVRIVLDRHLRLPKDLNLFDNSVKTLIFTENTEGGHAVEKNNLIYKNIAFDDNLCKNILMELTSKKIGILLVEGGRQLLQSFIDQGLWHEARVFTSSNTLQKGVNAPQITNAVLYNTFPLADNQLRIFKKC